MIAPRHETRGTGSSPTFSRALQYEWAGDDGAALVRSYAAAILLGVAWMLLVQFGPHTPLASAAPDAGGLFMPGNPVTVLPEFDRPLDGIAARRDGRAIPGGRSRATGSGASSIGGLFGGSQPAVNGVADLLRGVNVGRAGAAGSAPDAGAGKSVLAGGDGAPGGGARGGRGGQGGVPGGGSGLGAVRAGAGMGMTSERTEMSLPPAIVRAPVVGAVRDAASVGDYVRARMPQLQSCYLREGRARNPDLAGLVTLVLDVEGSGRVAGAAVASRSWSGAGSSETEACLVGVVRRWTLPSADETRGEYRVPVSFTAGR